MSKPRIEVYRDAAGQWRYRVLAANGETIAASEGYTRRADAQRGARDLLLATAEEIGAWDETTPQAKVGYAKPELDVDQAHALLERWLG